MADTPMMQQYRQAKAVCADALLLFRMGDFYELFFEDAKTAARVLGLTLTSRDKGADAVPMAGFPHHQLESYLAKLIAAGMRAAICDQVEDPKQAQGLVRREVTRIVTPGTLTDDALLDPRQHNYLAAIAPGACVGLAWVELSTGRFHAAGIAPGALADELARIAPAECLMVEDAPVPPEAIARPMLITRRPAWAFAHRAACDELLRHFALATLDGFGFDESAQDLAAICAAGALVQYLTETQRGALAHVDRLLPYRSGSTLELDESTRRSLEITHTIRDGSREGSLLAVMDRTTTAMGSRLLSDWVANPLTSREAITARHEAVGELREDASLCDALADELRGVYDVERLVARVSIGRASPRDLSFLARTLRRLPSIKARLTARTSALLVDLESRLDLCIELRARLDAALVDDCPLTTREGGIIRPGYDARLDELRSLATGGKQWIAEYQAQEAQAAGIPNLKIGFNSVFGYYIEVTHAHRDKVPAHYIRKQTIKSAERYITPELKEYEQKVLTADEESRQLEYELFVAARDAAAAEAPRLRPVAASLAELDALISLAVLARAQGYCRPKMVDEPILAIRAGRHPVLDSLMPQGEFVPNDALMGDAAGQIFLITGPNMAGKSTYIRQVALLVLMAQAGSFVPAEEATIGITDRIFARVGASDQLARGQSTFMVEMTETARILHNATPQSVVILDEIGRGTSTYDGVSLAWSVVEYLHDRVGCRTLFATHYHELADLARTLPSVRNLNVAVREWNDEVVFLHKIVEGAADKSYGIHVARLAGLPREVLERAKTLLARLEDAHLDGDGRPRMAAGRGQSSSERQLSLFAAPEHPLLAEVRAVDIGQTTPLAALGLIETWQQAIADKTPTPAAPPDEAPVKRQRPPKPKHKPAAEPCATGAPSSDTAAM